jgi:hypothetical protein
MNLEEVLTVHLVLQHQVTAYADKPDGSLKAPDIRPDDQCPLGRWIRTDGAVQQGSPEYAALMAAHEKFHRLSADIVRHADAGTLEKSMLGEKGAYKASLVEFVSAVMTMKRKTS